MAGITWNSALALAQWTLLILAVWATARLVLSVVCARFLPSSLSVGHVGWSSLGEVEWRRAANSSRTAAYSDNGQSHIKSIKISRVALAARSRGAKNSDRRLGWIGLAVSGVAVNVRLPAKNTPSTRQEQDPDTDHSPVYDDPRENATKSSHSHHAHAGNVATTTSRPSHSHTLWHIGELFIQSVRTIHDVRRGLRKLLLSNLPPHYRRRAVRQIGQLARGFRHKLVSPLLTRINALARRCGRVTMFLAVEVTDIAIKVPQVEAELKIGLFRFGGELVRGHDSHLGAWARIEQVALATATETAFVNKPKSSNSPKTPQSASATANNRAIELTGPLLVQAFAHFDPSIGIAGLYHRDEQGRLAPRKTILDLDFCFLKPHSSSSYGRDEAYKDTGIMTGTAPPSSIKLRLNSLFELAARLKDVYDPLGPEPHFGPHMGPHIHPRERDFDASSYVGGEDSHSRTISSSSQGDRPNQLDFENFAELQPIPTRRNPAGMLRSIEFCIPMVKLEAKLPALNHYAPTMNSTMKSDLDGTIALEVRLRGCAAHASLGDVLRSKDKHVEWFGRQTRLKAAIKLGFEKFDVDVMSSTYPAAPIAKSVRVLEISPSGAHLSSTWLPHRLDALFGEAKPEPETDDLGASSFASSQPPPSSPRTRLCKEGGVYNLAQDRSAQCIVLETDIGGVNGDASIGLLQAFVALWDRHKARQHPLFKHADEASETGSRHSLYVSGQLVDPPIIAVAIQLGRCGYRVTGPVTPHRTTFGPGEDDGGASPGWAAPSMICVHIPSISFNLSTRSVDIPLRRSDAQRREFRKHVKEGKLTIPDILQSENLASPEPGKIRRGSTRQLFASPVVDSRAFFASINERDGSQSMSPVSPTEPAQNFFTNFATGKVPFPRKQAERERNSTYSGDNDFMCFIAPDDGKIPQFARHTAASSDNTGKEANRHPFVYCIDGYVTCERVEVYLLSVGEAQSYADLRANPAAHGASSGHKRQRGSISTQPRSSASRRGVSHDRSSSRPQIHQRHDIALLGPFEIHVGLEFMGSEMMAGEDPLKDVIFISLVDTMECSGAVSLVSEALSADVASLDVHHCLSALIEICTEDRLALAPGDSGIFGSIEGLHSPTERSEKTGLSYASSEQPVKPFAQLLPANIHICLAFANIDIHIAGPDPKNTPQICRGVALQVSHLSVQHFRQDRHLPLRVEPHMRAPLSLPLDVRAHAHSVFNQQGKEPLQAFIVASLRSIRINPVRDSGKASKTMRAKATVDPQGRTTTDDVEIISVADSKWCNLPRDHFFAKKRSEAHQRRHEDVEQESSTGQRGDPGTKHAHSAIRDFLYIDEVEALICLWCMPVESSSPSERGAPVYGSWRDSATHFTQHEVVKPMQDFMGINVRTRSLVTRVEVFQLYCLLLAFSAIRSLASQAPRTDQAVIKARRPKVRPRVKVSVAQTHVYLTLPHKVKTYIGLRRFELSTYNEDDVYIKFTKGLLAGESKLCKGMWEQIVKLQSWSLAIKREPQNEGYHDRTFLLKGESGRLRIPCKYPFSEIIDNTGTFVKICKQLIHQFVKGKFGSAIEPVAEPAKRLPEMRIMVGALVVEAMDDPFEAKLNLIWNAGKAEQKARMIRDEYSDQLVEARMQEERDRQQSGAEPDTSKPSAQVLRRRLLKMKEASWIQRFKSSETRRINYETDLVKQNFGEIQTSIRNAPIPLVDHHGITPLLRLIANDIDLRITKPSFGGADNALGDFLHDVGKGMLRDTEYSLLIPFHLSWRMNGLRATIRDYPIPLLCIPTAKDEMTDPDDDTKSWMLDTDFVIAEQLGDHNSIRYVTATVVPAEHGDPGNRVPAYYMRVPRTAMPIKTFALPKITIRSDFATRVAWGNSLQPAIQDVMRVLESLTKTPPDPSERLGFWDKIRLILHWQIDIKFEGNAPLQLLLKGTRDPYTVMGDGAGFALSWHDGIRWKIGFDNPEKEFFQIFSSRFVLGVPDYKAYVMQTTTKNSHEKPQLREGPFKLERKKDDPKLPPGTQAEDRKELEMLKVCAKFQGGVRWGLGMQFERTCRDESCDHCYGSLFQRQCRMFDFKPHYAVKTISGSDATGIDSKTHDSYARFRSDFIHFSVSVTANEPGSSTNSIHLTPQGFTHFWAWWHLFDGTLSLPMRHGSVFESTAPPSKKFGKHCATIKYRLQLAPVFIAHAYKQDIVSDARKGLVTMLGVKGMMESFNVDLHQREQLERTRKPNSDEVSERLHKAFHRAEVDCVNTELRVFAARFAAVTDAEQAADGEDAEITDYLDLDEAQPVAAEDQIWLDDDDYVDLRVPLGRRQPNMHLLSCFKTPRFTYSRYSQHDTLHSPLDGDHAAADSNSEIGSEAAHSAVPKSKFGHEPTHTCLLESSSDAVDVQLAAMEKRVGELESLHQNKPGTRSASEWEELKTRLHVARMGVERFKAYRARKVSTNTMPEGAEKAAQQAEYRHTLRDKEHIPGFDVFDDLDQWINRLIIHNPNVVISQRIRDILLRYYYSSRQRRFFLYALTARAIKFIREHANETKASSKAGQRNSKDESEPTSEPRRNGMDDSTDTSDLLDELINEVTQPRGPGHAAKPERGSSASVSGSLLNQDDDPMKRLRGELAPSERTRNSFLVSLLKPQVCFNSDSGSHSSTVIVAAQAVQVRVCAVVDIDHIDDPINAIVRHRSFGRIDNLQAFYPHLTGWTSGRKETVLGHPNNFVPIEVLTGLSNDTHDLDRIVAPTNAQIIYDKNNRLRLVVDKESGGKTGGSDTSLDRFKVLCDRFTVTATPKHYAAIFDVVTNLLLYSDPNQKSHNQRLEQLVLSKDFSDSDDITHSIAKQQSDVRKIHDRYCEAVDNGLSILDNLNTKEFAALSAEVFRRRELLTLWLAAIQASQSSARPSKSNSLQLDARAPEIVWHMLESDGKPLAKVAVKDIYFCWQNRSDGGVSNSLIIRDLVALNSSVSPYFPEIVTKHPYGPSNIETRFGRADIFVAVIWSMLSPVGGISIVDHFQLHLHPIRLQMEQVMADQIKHYIFSQRDMRNKDEAASIGSRRSEDTAKSSQLSARSQLSKTKSNESLSAARKAAEKRDLKMTSSQQNLSVPSSSASQASSGGKHPSSRPRSLYPSSEETLSLQMNSRDDHLDAAEMRERARLNRTFLHVELFPTVLCLSFKGDKNTSLPDVYGLIYKSPTIIHCNRIWTYLDLLENIKKDFKSSIWSQSATLIGQLLTTARKPKNAVQQTVSRSLGFDKGDRQRRKSLTASIRSRLSVGGHPEDRAESRSSPLRTSTIREVDHDDDDDENEDDAEEDESDSDSSEHGEVVEVSH